MKVKVLTGIAYPDRALEAGDVVDMPEKMARAYAAEGAVEIVEGSASVPESEPKRRGSRRAG